MTPASIAALDWPRISANLDSEGYAMLPAFLDTQQTTSLPDCLQALLPHLAPIAQQWSERMNTPLVQPSPHVHIASSRLEAGDYVPLHQHIHGAPAFAPQLVILLSSPGADFTGGEFVITEQRPRMQSRPMVLPLAAGDAALIAVARRPMRGARGDYQVNASHAISRVRSGERLGIECFFHNPIGTATFRS